jgi:hypothetical protein
MNPHDTLWERVLANINDLVLFAAVAFFFGLIKILTAANKMNLRYNLITLFVSVVVGTMAGQIALETGSADFISLGVASLASLLSREIIGGILNKQFIADLAKQAATNVVDKVTK